MFGSVLLLLLVGHRERSSIVVVAACSRLLCVESCGPSINWLKCGSNVATLNGVPWYRKTPCNRNPTRWQPLSWISKNWCYPCRHYSNTIVLPGGWNFKMTASKSEVYIGPISPCIHDWNKKQHGETILSNMCGKVENKRCQPVTGSRYDITHLLVCIYDSNEIQIRCPSFRDRTTRIDYCGDCPTCGLVVIYRW